MKNTCIHLAAKAHIERCSTLTNPVIRQLRAPWKGTLSLRLDTTVLFNRRSYANGQSWSFAAFSPMKR